MASSRYDLMLNTSTGARSAKAGCTAAIALLLVASGGARAVAADMPASAPQTPSQGAAQGNANQSASVAPTAGIEEIVVVGKKTQDLRNIAGTVNVLSAQSLEDVGASDAEDIMKLVPGVQFDKGTADGSLLTIRGVGFNTTSDNVSVGQLPTGEYVEDVPFTDPYQYVSTPDVPAFDLDNVSVLRGPQGALYGSGSLGGAVNYTFRKPDLSTFGGVVEAKSQSAEGGETTGSFYGEVNVPLITDKLAARIVVLDETEPGYQDNIGTGQKDANEKSVESQRFLLRFSPIDNLTIDAMYVDQRSHQDDTSASVAPDVRYYDSPTATGYNSTFSLSELTANYTTDWVKITSITAYETKRRDQFGDLSRLLIPDATIGFDVPSQDVFGFGPLPQVKVARNYDFRRSRGDSEEFRLASPEKGVFNWLVGVFGQNIDSNRTQDVTLEGADIPGFGDRFFDVYRAGTTKERAAFGEGDLEIGGFEASAGGRYFDDNVSFHQIRQASLTAGASDGIFHIDETGFTPKFETRYRFDDEALIYALAAKGFRFGGINTAPGNKPFTSDSLWNYETGIRLNPTPTVDLQLSGFYVDWSNAQVTTADQNGFLIVSNVPHAESMGLEFDGHWRALPNLKFSASGAYTYAVTRSPLESTANFGTDVAGGYTGNFTVPSGTQLPGTPRVQANLVGEFDTPGPFDTDGVLTATLSYTGDRRAQIDSDLRLPGYVTLDLRAAVESGPWEAALSIQNLFNSSGISSADFNYYSTGIGKDGYADYYLIRPRIIGLSLKRTF